MVESFEFAFTVRPVCEPPFYYFVNGKRVSREDYHKLESKCVYFYSFYTDRTRNGRYRHGKVGRTE